MCSLRSGMASTSRSSTLNRACRASTTIPSDHVIMSLSLQTVRHTVPLVQEMLRVGHEAVVSFPNFGHRSHREAIARGRMPVSEALRLSVVIDRRTCASSRLPISKCSVPTTASSV